VIAVAVGLGVFALLVARWRRARRARAAAPPPAVDPAMRERIRREMDAEP
jgi:hypothetical protein